MKIYKIKTQNLFFAVFLALIILLKPFDAAAWVGYEEDTNIMIDILPDTEVEIGQDISYYDYHDKSYHNAYVSFTDFGATGARIEVKEIESNKKRVFIMDE